MKRFRIVWLAAVVVAVGVLLTVLRGRWSIHEGWCTLRYQKGPSSDDSIMINMVERMLLPLPGQPRQIRDLPPAAGLARFYHVECGDGSSVFLCLLPGRRLYVDTDRDGLLSDQSCLQGVECGPPGRDWEYGPVRLKSAAQGGTAPRFRVRSFRQDIPSPVFVHPDGYQTGSAGLCRQRVCPHGLRPCRPIGSVSPDLLHPRRTGKPFGQRAVRIRLRRRRLVLVASTLRFPRQVPRPDRSRRRSLPSRAGRNLARDRISVRLAFSRQGIGLVRRGSPPCSRRISCI